MYDKCEKCGRILASNEPRKLLADQKGVIHTQCMPCYEKMSALGKKTF